jgi:hypothetical protein
MGNWQIIQTVREFVSGEGQYAVVKFANETYGITLNGQPLTPFFWHAGQLEDCIQMTSRLAKVPPAQPTIHAA